MHFLPSSSESVDPLGVYGIGSVVSPVYSTFAIRKEIYKWKDGKATIVFVLIMVING
jgi:hypothetical protein